LLFYDDIFKDQYPLSFEEGEKQSQNTKRVLISSRLYRKVTGQQKKATELDPVQRRWKAYQTCGDEHTAFMALYATRGDRRKEGARSFWGSEG